MKLKWDRQGLAALLTAFSLLLTGAWTQPQGAWWCTAFSVVCDEAAAPADKAEDGQKIVFKWKLAELWREIMG